jgi:ribonuclease J
MTSLEFHGGVGEIGGNKILVDDGDTRLLFDFGMPFGAKGKFYSAPFLSPRCKEALLEFGFIPDLDGLYVSDEAESPVDAVLLSHSHMDHSSYTTFLKRSIPVHCGETTATILGCLQEMGPKTFEFNLEGINFVPFRTGDTIKIGSIQVEPIHVDHSVPGAYGFIIHTSEGAIVYTGDFRSHGTAPQLTRDFLEAAKTAAPTAMVSEATNTTGASPSSEPIVEQRLTEVVGQSNGLVLADFARADVDRIRSFFRAAKANGRRLGVSLKQACLLRELSQDPHLDVPGPDDAGILIFKRTKKTYRRWEREILEGYDNVVDSQQMGKVQGEVVLACSLYNMEELVRIRPSAGSCYILSGSEPFNEEMEIDFAKLLNWLRHYGLPQYHIHTSGHIMPLELRDAIRSVHPQTVFPIHTEDPQMFASCCRSLESKFVVPDQGQAYEVQGS